MCSGYSLVEENDKLTKGIQEPHYYQRKNCFCLSKFIEKSYIIVRPKMNKAKNTILRYLKPKVNIFTQSEESKMSNEIKMNLSEISSSFLYVENDIEPYLENIQNKDWSKDIPSEKFNFKIMPSNTNLKPNLWVDEEEEEIKQPRINIISDEVIVGEDKAHNREESKLDNSKDEFWVS